MNKTRYPIKWESSFTSTLSNPHGSTKHQSIRWGGRKGSFLATLGSLPHQWGGRRRKCQEGIPFTKCIHSRRQRIPTVVWLYEACVVRSQNGEQKRWRAQAWEPLGERGEMGEGTSTSPRKARKEVGQFERKPPLSWTQGNALSWARMWGSCWALCLSERVLLLSALRNLVTISQKSCLSIFLKHQWRTCFLQ